MFLSMTKNYIYLFLDLNTDDNDIQLSDIDINGYRNSEEEIFYSIVTIFISGFNTNIYDLNFYNKLI